MKLTLSNKIDIEDFTPLAYQQIVHRFTFANPAFAEAVKHGRSTRLIDRTIKLFTETDAGLSLPIGCLQYLIDTYSPEINDLRDGKSVTIEFNGELRTYQERFISLAMQHTNGVMVATTGAGKTISGIAMASRLGQRTLILVKSKDLAKQWQDAIKQFTGLEAGLMGGGKDTEGEVFTIGLTQTLIKRDLAALQYGLIIVDECQNIPAKQAYEVINGLNARYKFGLSATPQRRDGLEFMIHGALGEIVSKVEPHELGDKVLPVEVITLHMNFNGSPESWNDFLSILVNDENRNLIIIDKAIRSANKRGTIILCGQVKHCEILAALAREQGVNPLVLHGQLPTKERSARMAMAAEAPLIIGTLSLLSEGIDLPHLGALIFASPVSAEPDRDNPAATRLRQSIGRCRRPFLNKQRAFVLDICDKHPFGYSAFNKRMAIYKQQSFEVKPL